jgi:Plasmid pRiA4b ORF-3-like protein
MSTNTVVRLKITLDAVKPAVLRRIEAPFDIRLDRLHLTIKAGLGWTNSHLYEIRAGDVGWSTLYPEVIEDVGTQTLRYIYDFGDGWEHTIKMEQLTEPEPGALYPRLIAATGRCPPEDCGGPWGYAEFLDAIRDPAHERHAELKEWIGCDFDPDHVDSEELAANVAMLAKQWARTPARRRTRRA